MKQFSESCDKVLKIDLAKTGVAAGPFNLAAITAGTAVSGGAAAGATDDTKAKAAVASLMAFEQTCRNVQGLSSGALLTQDDVQTLRALHPDMSELAVAVASLQPAKAGDENSVFGSPSKAEFQGPIPALADPLGTVESTLINGLARFLLDRAKAEAILYLSKQLEETLCTEEGKRYFRNFCATFDGLDAHLQLASMGVYLRAAALRDLQRIPELTLADGSCAKDSTAEPLAAARLGLAFFRESRDGRSPLEIGRNLHRVKLECEVPVSVRFEDGVDGKLSCTQTTSALRMGSWLLEAIQQQRGWELMPYTTPESPRWSYFSVSALLSYETLAGAPLDISKFTALFAGVHRASIEVVRIHKLLGQLRDERRDGDDAARFTIRDRAALVAQAVRAVTDAAAMLGTGMGSLSEDEARRLARVGDVAAVGQRLLEEADPGALAIAAADLTERLSKLVPGMKDGIPPIVSSGMPLVVELANADSSETVVRTLEAAAAPVGSYSTKYERPSVTLNALLGAAYSYEWLDDVTDTTNGSTLSVFAPIGVHASWPVGKKFHLGGMVSVFDLGAVVSPRLSSETHTLEGGGEQEVLAEPNVGFEQVLSPGVFLLLGVAESPIILGTGFSMVPSLRKVSTTEILADGSAQVTIDERNAFRWSVFASMDLTLLPF
ncbi:hypothetical protein ACLESO_21645 [Pyxidicoccus sp. 3LG]